MEHNEIIQYYDHLMRLATRKCHTQADAEDLVGETLLAAFAYLHRGGTIEHPKSWLTNTLFHKHNDSLRQKYRAPTVVCLDESAEIADEQDEAYLSSEEAARVRKELNHLGFITREVLLRHYFGNQGVADIAKGLGIPEGTVKSRLSAGRQQMKKGLEAMETKENHLPGQLHISFGGSAGPKHEPMSLVEGDLIVQNLLILAYEKPLSISDLSKAVGIPAAYIEPIIQRLVDGELMVEMDGGKVYTDFIITRPQDIVQKFDAQLAFARKHFDAVWAIIESMSQKIAAMPFVQRMEKAAQTKLDRYAILKALQDFEFFGTGKIEAPRFPNRRDGGRWLAQGIAFDAGYDAQKYWESTEYMINGGHRSSMATVAGGSKRVWFYEFDTRLWDNPHRFGGMYEMYFKHIIPFLWSIHTESFPQGTEEIPNEVLSKMPVLELVGLIGQKDGKPCVTIPVVCKEEYEQVNAVIRWATEQINAAIGEEFAAFIATMKTATPKHLTSVPELFKYREATVYFVMSIVREAYEKGLHLQGVDYCCPPTILVWRDEQA